MNRQEIFSNARRSASDSGAATAGVARSPWFPPILALLVVCGVAEAIIMVADRSIQQRRTPDAVRSRVSSASESMVDIALSFGFVLGGPAVAALGPRWVYALGGAFGLIGAAVLIPVLRSSKRASADREASLELELDGFGSDELVVERVGG